MHHKLSKTHTKQKQMQQTYAMIKPDAVIAGYTDAILKRIIDSGFRIIVLKKFRFTDESIEYFYEEHKEKSWFPQLKEFMMSGDCVGMVLEHNDAVMAWRQLIGPTNIVVAKKSAPESLRALYGDESNSSKNACHGSDSETSAKREIAFFDKK